MSAPADWSAGPCPWPIEVEQYGHVRKARCAKRSCPSCGKLWLGDTRIKVLASCQQLRAAVALVTVTAPGRDVLPWDCTGARVRDAEAEAWNATAPERWASLHRAAAEAARTGGAHGRQPWRVVCRVWEYQKRGVLHLHLVVPYGNSAEAAASTRYVAALVRLAPAAGFGFVDRGRLPQKGARQSSRRLEAVEPHRAAAYVAAYVASSGAGKPGIAEVARKQGVPGAIVYVDPNLVRRAGCSMRSLRLRRTILTMYPRAASSPQEWRAACMVHSLSRRRAPFTPAFREALLVSARDSRWTDAIVAPSQMWLSPVRAAVPNVLREGPAAPVSLRRTGMVRLDPVVHDCHPARGTVRWWSTGSVVPNR